MHNLTTRQQEIIALVAKGISNKLIAFELGISTGTVKVYMFGIFRKVGVSNRTELAIWALTGRNIPVPSPS